MSASHTLASRLRKRNFKILSDHNDSDCDIEEGNETTPQSNKSSTIEKKPRVVKRRQLTTKNGAGVELIDSNMPDTDLVTDVASEVESVNSETHTSRTPNRSKIHNCTWPDCGKVYDIKTKLTEHMRSHTGERPYTCPVEGCDKSYMKNAQLQVHILTHDESYKTAFRCPFDGCGAAFPHKHRLKNHLKVHEQPHEFVCDWEGCGAAFVKPFQLRNHMCTHTNKKPHQCTHPGCEKSFDTRPKLNVHMAGVHSTELRYFCGHEGCDATFAKYPELQYHTKHDHEKKCSICGKVYESRSMLTYHIRTVHEQQELFSCHWDGCGKEFKMKSSLRYHIMHTHRNTKPFKCEHDGCAAAFLTLSSLRRHIKSKHDPKEDQEISPPAPAPAPEISVLTGYSENGTNKQRSFNCPFGGCGMTFWREYDLKRHIESKSHECELSQELQKVDA
ncbi:hypothetical protein INT44_005912 [Umbelopsis vinacea]|uniref:C2H2-type domain-containing protein n=1 Tax=Umbelopsis vinacea TaxID=44442 RepID=A0A8H7UEN6_9FUNG|nr:hypothetical protein INT44_005912 [Umbelopsis vinacea]